ncbi:MAG: hypothetical protein KAI24_09850 [Planctomycetes bacterium]|nr:hypothetical protein [Planctomycetota bacterium]
MLRNIFCLLVVAMLAIHVPGDEGGENASGTGVWILPACAAVVPQQLGPTSPSRAQFIASDLSKAALMEVSNGLGVATAVFTDDLLGTPVALTVSGKIVTVPASLMSALAQSSVKTGTILITNANQDGYVLRVKIVGTTAVFDCK